MAPNGACKLTLLPIAGWAVAPTAGEAEDDGTVPVHDGSQRVHVASRHADDQVDLVAAVARITHRLRTAGEREVPALQVGEMVMEELRELDAVAYVRFASVYRSFQDVEEFREEVERLRAAAAAAGDSDQMPLLPRDP